MFETSVNCPQLSSAIGGAKLINVSHALFGKVKNIAGGQADRIGAVLSSTVTVNVQVEKLPESSVAVYITSCSSTTGKKVPG